MSLCSEGHAAASQELLGCIKRTANTDPHPKHPTFNLMAPKKHKYSSISTLWRVLKLLARRDGHAAAAQELLGLLGCIKGTAKVLSSELSWLGPLAEAGQEAAAKHTLEAALSQLPESTSPEV